MNQIKPNLQRITFFVVNFILIMSFCSSSAQEITKKNNIYLELLGNGILYSINYERIIPVSEQLKLAPRVGFELLPIIKINDKKNSQKNGNWHFPTEINLIWSRNKQSKNQFEAGLGLNFFSLIEGYTINSNNEVMNNHYKMAKISTLRLGYRYQKPEGGLMYRAGLLVRLTQDDFSKSRFSDDLFYKIWPGFSIGYTF